MADVKIIDIDGEQWNIKDEPLTARVANLETTTSTKSLPDIELNLSSGYTVSSKSLVNHYSVGKIHFVTVHLNDLKGNNIGTNDSAFIGSINIHPKKETTFLLYEYKSRCLLRCYISPSGVIGVGESGGVTSGDNGIFGELIFAEE